MTTPAIAFYDVVVAAHVVANVSAFGILLAWPLLPGGTPAAHGARARILARVVTYAATLGLVLGLYLASDRDLFGEPWVLGPLVILVVLLGIVGGYLTPAERRLGELAAQPGSEEAWTRARRGVDRAALACFALAAVATFLMVTKPGL
jgi:hypothetical protein